ncbi:MAG TPA: glycosyltransferase family 2 protein [Terriglobales bacterium]|jgi:GT2 family glycosyltransferase|nr:glycosyltransferase family 2 protein [Terriglobales bacterium]
MELPLLQKLSSPSITVIIPALRRPDLTQRCLRSLALQKAAGLEIVIVENEAQQNTIFHLETLPVDFPYPVRQILLEQNLGTTDSINRALQNVGPEFILLLNNDVELEPQFATLLVEKLKSDSQLAFSTGKLLNAQEKTRFDGAGDALLLGGGAYRLGHQDVDSGQFDQSAEAFVGCGAATLYRRSAFEHAGGLDGDFFAYLDDVDLAFRLQLGGWCGAYVPNAVAYHIGSATLGDSMHPRIVRWMTRNQILLLLKNYPASVFFRLLPRIWVYQFLWFLMILRRGNALSYIGGIFDAVKLLGSVPGKRKQVQSQRKITSTELIQKLRASEAQIYAWHCTRDAKMKSALLRIYFGLFGKPRAISG